MWRANWRQSVNNGTCIAAGAFFSFTGSSGRGGGERKSFLSFLFLIFFLRRPCIDCPVRGYGAGFIQANEKVGHFYVFQAKVKLFIVEIKIMSALKVNYE